jgi:membrane protein YdbS with pleckstrin-like domain
MLLEERQPAEQPSARAVKHWRIKDALAVTLVFLVATSIAAARSESLIELVDLFHLPLARILAGAAAAFVLAMVWFVGLLPLLGVRYYRFELTDDAVYCQRGLLTRTRTMIPYARVQSVKSTTGPIERRLGLTSLVLLTAAHAHKIRMLDEELADELRERVCRLAREAGDDR